MAVGSTGFIHESGYRCSMSEGDDRRVGEPHVLDGVSNGFIHCKYVAFEFRFRTAATNPNTFLYNTCPITALDSPSWNRKQWYSASMCPKMATGSCSVRT